MMQKTAFILITVLSLAGLATAYALIHQTSAGQSFADFGNTTVSLEVAASRSEQQQGLKNRTEMPADSGMIFVFRPRRKNVNFWMQNTLIPLDLIFLRDGRVVKTFEKLQPPSSEAACLQKYSCDDVTEAIEVNAGFVAANKVKVGDKVCLNLHYDPKVLEDFSDRLSRKITVLSQQVYWTSKHLI